MTVGNRSTRVGSGSGSRTAPLAGAVVALALLLGALLPTGAAATNLSYGFDAGSEGWKTTSTDCVFAENTSPLFSASEGNPGGFIYNVDNDPEPLEDVCPWALVAPFDSTGT